MTIPYPFQEKGVRKLNHFGLRALLGDDMGLGKSFQALLAIKRHLPKGNVVVICPTSVKYNWEREASIHVNMRAQVLETTNVPKFSRLLAPARLYVINYKILGPWLKFLKRLKPKLVVIDECQAVSNRNTQQSKNVRALCRGVPHVIALSGTPLINRPAELWPVLNMIRPDRYKSFFDFAWKYCKPRRRPWGWDFKGASNLDELHQELNTYVMIRRRKADVLKQLPDKTRSVVPITLQNRKEYDHAYADFIGWLRKFSRTRANRAAKAEKLVKIGYLRRLTGWLKVQSVIAWVKDYLAGSNGGKLILFTSHKAVLAELHKVFKRICVKVDGGTSAKERQLFVEKFNHDKHTRLFIGNIRAANSGWNGTSASAVAFAELDWTPGAHKQAEDRAHRIGQTRKVSVYYLVGIGTIEEDLCKILQKKQAVLDSTLDGGESGDLDVYDELERVMLAREREYAV